MLTTSMLSNISVSLEGVHLTLPPYIFSVQVKSRSILHHGSVGTSLKQTKPNPKPNLNLLLPFTVFYNKICLYHNFYGLFTAYLLYEELMSVRLYSK